MSSRTSDWAHEVSAVLVDLKHAEVVKVVLPVKVEKRVPADRHQDRLTVEVIYTPGRD